MIKHIIVSIFGLLGFTLTVGAITALEHFTGFNLFSLSILVVIPVGAALSGFAAASGFYLGSLLMQVRPNLFLLVQVITFAALAQLAIYYSEYRLMVLDDGTVVSGVVGFRQYLDIYLSSLHMRVGRGAGVDTGEMGSFGYIVAGLQFVGFIIGGIAVYGLLRAHPACEACALYMKKLAKREQKFAGQEDFSPFYEHLFDVEVDGPKFDMLLNWFPHQGKIEKGNLLSKATLRGCPRCKGQLVSQEVSIFAKDGWKDVPKLTRHLRIPTGIDLKPTFTRVTLTP